MGSDSFDNLYETYTEDHGFVYVTYAPFTTFSQESGPGLTNDVSRYSDVELIPGRYSPLDVPILAIYMPYGVTRDGITAEMLHEKDENNVLADWVVKEIKAAVKEHLHLVDRRSEAW